MLQELFLHCRVMWDKMRAALNSREILASKAEKVGLARKSQDQANDCVEVEEAETYPIWRRCIRYGIGVTDIVNDSVTPISVRRFKQPSAVVCL